MGHMTKSDADNKVGSIPRISMDYFYMSKKDEDAKEFPLIVAVDEETGDKFARATGKKGVGEAGECDWLINELSE